MNVPANIQHSRPPLTTCFTKQMKYIPWYLASFNDCTANITNLKSEQDNVTSVHTNKMRHETCVCLTKNQSIIFNMFCSILEILFVC